jgi:hypothetical protein
MDGVVTSGEIQPVSGLVQGNNQDDKPASEMSTQFPVELWTTIFSDLDFESLQKKIYFGLQTLVLHDQE